MPRPRKWRRVCAEPLCKAFIPLNSQNLEEIILTVEEYETVRLLDFKGLTQEECAEMMDVARSTVQRIYDEARHKIADALVNGKTIRIEGGDYQVCGESDGNCDIRNCRKHRHGMDRQEN